MKELFYSHARGQSVAVRLRHSRQLPTLVDKSLLGHTNRWLIWRDLADRRRPSPDIYHYLADLHSSWLEGKATELLFLAADVCGRVRLLMEASVSIGTTDTEELASCIVEAVHVNDSISACFQAAPTAWAPETISVGWEWRPALLEVSPPTLSNLEYPLSGLSEQMEPREEHDCRSSQTPTPQEVYLPRLDIYSSQSIAFLWNYIRCAQLHVLRTMVDLRLLESSQMAHLYSTFPTYDTLRTDVSSTYIRTYEFRSKLTVNLSAGVIHSICASIPYQLNDIAFDLDGAPRIVKSNTMEACRSTNLVGILYP